MTVARRPLTTALSVAVVMSVAASVAGCSKSYDTTQVKTVDQKRRNAASTTSIVVETVPTTTTIDFASAAPAVPAVMDLQGTLSELVSGFAIDPELLAQVQGLANGDLASIAKMFNIDLGALSQLGMSVAQIASLGESVARSASTLLQQVAGGAGGIGGITFDPATLIGLLVNSVDINGLAQGAVAGVIQLLADALTKTTIVLSPDVTIYIDELANEFDPDGFGEISANPDNAALIALITSVLLSAHPLLTDQLLGNPHLDPRLKEVLGELQKLNSEIGATASASILEALKRLFPDLAAILPAQ